MKLFAFFMTACFSLRWLTPWFAISLSIIFTMDSWYRSWLLRSTRSVIGWGDLMCWWYSWQKLRMVNSVIDSMVTLAWFFSFHSYSSAIWKIDLNGGDSWSLLGSVWCHRKQHRGTLRKTVYLRTGKWLWLLCLCQFMDSSFLEPFFGLSS